MHEHGITQRILEVALARAIEAEAGRITVVHLEIGEESDVSPESVGFYWPEVSRGTAAQDARLQFESVADPWAFRVVAIDAETS